MIQIRIHGRGGQGAVLAAELIAKAAVLEGKYAQSSPMFGPERRGAPVQSFARIAEQPIRIRGLILEPDVILVLDRGLAHTPDVGHGLNPNGTIILNSPLEPAQFSSKFSCSKIACLDATKIALDTFGRPIVNTPMLGAFCRATGLIKLESLLELVKHEFPGELGIKNAQAIQAAYPETKIWLRD